MLIDDVDDDWLRPTNNQLISWLFVGLIAAFIGAWSSMNPNPFFDPSRVSNVGHSQVSCCSSQSDDSWILMTVCSANAKNSPLLFQSLILKPLEIYTLFLFLVAVTSMLIWKNSVLNCACQVKSHTLVRANQSVYAHAYKLRVLAYVTAWRWQDS